MTLSMKAEIKERWVKALRSGAYQQGAGELHTLPMPKADGTELDERFCCLGVLSLLAHEDGAVECEQGPRSMKYGRAGEVAYLAQEVVDWAGLSYEGWRDYPQGRIEERQGVLTNGTREGKYLDGKSLSKMNDSGDSFTDIADAIEADVIGV